MVEVWDDDDLFHDDFVEMLSGYIDFSRALGASDDALSRGFKVVLMGRTRLAASLSINSIIKLYSLL